MKYIMALLLMVFAMGAVAGELTPAETPAVQRQLRELLGALAAGASLPAPP